MNKKSMIWGIILILLAVYLIVVKMGVVPAIPVTRIVMTLIFGYWAVRGIMKADFLQITISLAILGWVYDDFLGIQAITPWVLLIAAALIGIGLNMIFKRKSIKAEWEYCDGKEYKYKYKWKRTNAGCSETMQENNGFFHLENNFGTATRYVNSVSFAGADIENNFGQTNIYFDNAVIEHGAANIRVENNFGETKLYFPREWRMEMREEKAFASIKVNGMCSQTADAPVVRVNAECNFGSIVIYFN